jgi:hypothetical protein
MTRKLEDKALKDSGQRTTFSTGGKRDLRPGKGRYDLLPGYAIAKIMELNGGKALPPNAIRSLSKVYEAGCRKYSDRNWERGIPLWSFFNSGTRHLYQVLTGETDENHYGQSLWNLVCALDTELAIRDKVMPESLRDPKPRIQSGKIDGIDKEPETIDTVIYLVHSHMGTGNYDILIKAIIMLCNIIDSISKKDK